MTAKEARPSPQAPSLPDSTGGYYKTGKPYRVGSQVYYPLSSAAGYDATGIASWYGKDFHGQKTANGERYDMHALSAAHPTLPLPTMVRVTNLENGRQIIVRVNDRGPFVKNRLIDLSYTAARLLGFADKGTCRVRVRALVNRPGHRSDTPSPTAVHSPMYVQVGAFSSPENARELKFKLLRHFSAVKIQQSEREIQTWYRVRIGPMYDSSEIEQTVISLQHLGYAKSIVVTE